jgi:hypothetical protein
MIDRTDLFPESKCNSAITVATAIIVIYLFDPAIYFIIFTRRFQRFQMIIKCAPGDLGYTEQLLKGMMLP